MSHVRQFARLILAIMREIGDEKTFNEIFSIFKSQKVPDQKLAALGALAGSRSKQLIEKALELSLKEEPVRPQDSIYLFTGAGRNVFGRRLCFEFMQRHWNVFHERYGRGGLALLSRIVTSSTDSLTTEQDAETVEKFFADKDTSSIDRAINQSVEKIRANSGWLERNRQGVSDFLCEAGKEEL